MCAFFITPASIDRCDPGVRMESYIVRIYRRGRKDGPATKSRARQLVGTVEDGEGRRRAFHSSAELWEALWSKLSGQRASGDRRGKGR